MSDVKDSGAAAVGAVTSFAALVSAAACCVLPLVFAAVGFGVGGLSVVVPFRWPLTAIAAAALGVGWALYLRRRGRSPARRATLIMLAVGSAMTALSASWSLFEQPLMDAFGG